MKNILIILFAAISFGASAQSTSPRFGTVPGDDNTFRVLTNGLIIVTDAAGADSATINSKFFNTYVKVALTDSVTLKSPVVTRSYYGDRMTIIATGTSGKKLKFTGANWISTGTATLSSSGRSVISFVFDGAKWVESGRVTQ